jgi:hypothetical protein
VLAHVLAALAAALVRALVHGATAAKRGDGIRERKKEMDKQKKKVRRVRGTSDQEKSRWRKERNIMVIVSAHEQAEIEVT